MAKLTKDVKLRFSQQPRGFVSAFKKEMQDLIDKRAPLGETGKLEKSTRVKSAGGGTYKFTNSRNYASYVDKSGPRADSPKGSATQKFFTGVVNSRVANRIARKVRKRLGGK